MKERHGYKRLLFLGLLLVMDYGVTRVWADGRQDRTDDVDVSFILYRPSDALERAVAGLRLQLSTVVIGKNAPSLKEFLQRSHIWPDADAFGLMYALNSDLNGAGPIRAGTELRFPSVDSPEIAKAISEGFWVKLRYDGHVISEILSAQERIAALAAAVGSLPDERFEKPDAARPCVSEGSQDLLAITSALQQRDNPVDHEMLLQVNGDANVLSETLQKALANGDQKLSAAESEKICRVAKDLRIKQETFGSVRGATTGSEKWPRVLVVVHTINTATLNQVPGLTVYYVPEALQGRAGWEKPVGALSSPVSVSMPEADYVFWATRGRVVVSEYKKCPVREEGDKPYVCDLPVKP